MKSKEEKKRRRRRRGDQASQRYGTWIFGMKTNLDYEFHEIWHVSLGCMMIILLKPRVLLGFHLSPKFVESKVDKTLNSIRRS